VWYMNLMYLVLLLCEIGIYPNIVSVSVSVQILFLFCKVPQLITVVGKVLTPLFMARMIGKKGKIKVWL
jgi:hypothetical protein